MKLVTDFFRSSSSSRKEGNKRKVRKNGGGAKSASFGSATTSSSDEAPTPRTVLPPSPSEKKKPAVTREELEAALRKVVSSESELAEMLAEAGVVVEGEVAAAADEADLKEAFAVFDADGDGRISAEELRAALASLGDDPCSVEDCRRMIRGVDTDGDGFVCFQEFTRMMTTMQY
jgi:calcium-binding protein CML